MESFKLAPLSDALLSKAKEELNEVPSERAEDIRTFSEAVLTVPNLKSRTDDEFLLRFLRASKFKQDRALNLLINYYKQKIKYPDLYTNLSTVSIPTALAVPLLGFLPHRDSQGRAIFVFNTADLWDPSIVTIDDVIKYCLLSLERAIVEADVQINGIVCIVDCKGFGLTHLRCASISKLAQMIFVTQQSFPARIKDVHIINEPRLFYLVFTMMKMFLKEKLRDRFHFHGQEVESLHEFLERDLLPEEFGGNLGPFCNRGWNRLLVQNDLVVKQWKNFGFQDTD